MAKAKTTKKTETKTDDTVLTFKPVIETEQPENKTVENQKQDIQENKDVKIETKKQKPKKKKNNNYFAKISDFLHF